MKLALATFFTLFVLLSSPTLYGDYSPPGSSSGSSFPESALPAFPKSPEEKAPEKFVLPPVKKTHLPVMSQPLGLPGVLGVVNNQWENSDYLGYLSPNLAITVELLLGKDVPKIDPGAIQKAIGKALQKQFIIPVSDVKEGPILPFLHYLVVVYPIENSKFVVFTNLRLFEEINVVRKRFTPAGVWQGITWENQDVNITTGNTLQTDIETMADKQATIFATRFYEYNKDLGKEHRESEPQ